MEQLPMSLPEDPRVRDDDPSCPFCAITHGRTPGVDFVWQDERVVAFLDHRPLFPGHVLVVPRRHVPTLPDLPAEDLGPLFSVAQRLAAAVVEATGADGTFVAVNNRVSQSVPHLHVHVVPRRFHDGLRGFFWPRRRYESDAERDAVRTAIAEVAGRAPR
jgi:histidine triad (HIT) family protein